MRNISVLLTDLDGTLIKSEQPICAALRECFIAVGQAPPTDAEIMGMFGLPVEVMLTTLSSVKETDSETIALFIAEYKVQYPLHMVRARLIDGAFEQMRYFYENKVQICLITSERKANALHILKALGLDKYIKSIISRDDVVNFKPHPEPLINAMALLNKSPNDCAYIGESPFDIQAGKASGVYTIAVPSGHWSAELLTENNPDLFINSISELRQYLRPKT